MKLADPATTFEGNLPAGTRLTFQLKSNPKMFAILSDGIYADKISAVIRELSCNAHDSNVMARSTRPFTVNVPTSLETNFWVEDTGLGIDPDKIVEIFWTYGASTKTDSNDTIGALGLGSKSPFAYTKSSFLVINRFNGIEYKYFCFINEVGIPDGKLVYQSATAEPNGVRVELAVRADDIGAFRERIIRFFSFWNDANMPVFTGDSTVFDAIKDIKARRTIAGQTWELRGPHEGRGSYAVMGGVPYPINRRNLSSLSQALETICDSAINITFPMGSLDFQVSREELSYTDETIKALEAASKDIINDVLKEARAKLVGFATPFELSLAYRIVFTELNRSFKYVARLLMNEAFKLVDGRSFLGINLTDCDVSITKKSHVPFCIQRIERQIRDYTKGRQYYGLETELSIELIQPEVRDAAGKLTRWSAANTVPWFKPSTVAAPWTNQHRKRTAANYLHDGFNVEATYFRHNNSHRFLTAAFIINDLQDRGTEGIRFYTEPFDTPLLEAFQNTTLYFVDGSAELLPTDVVESGLKAFIANTLLEGTPIVRLSTLPKFKLPEAPKVAATQKPRAQVQRGTVEQRMTVYKFDAQSSVITEIIDGFPLKFYSSTTNNTAYVRHELIKPMLYIETNWGAPITPFDKDCIEPNVIGALYTLGLLDDFMYPTPTGFEIRVGMLSQNHIDELKQRKVPLVSFRTLFAKMTGIFDKQTELIAAFNSRANGPAHSTENVTLMRLLSKHFISHGLKHLATTNKIAILATVHDRIKTLLGDYTSSALIYLVFHGGRLKEVTKELKTRLNGRVDTDDLLTEYPLLRSLSCSCEYDDDPMLHEHIAAYINAVDAQHAQAKEAAKLEELAALHAEALFEHTAN